MDISKHDLILKNILRDIYTAPSLQASLGFKGGTCLYLFYGLDRFSVDLDFNLIGDNIDERKLSAIVAKYLKITDSYNKHNTWFWMGSYSQATRNVKLEVSKRSYPDKYIIKDFYGLSVLTMDPSYMFAHKLCAITDRKNFQNRDIYDARFMFSQGFKINEEIIRLRTGKAIDQYFSELIDFIDKKVSNSNVLNGLGDLLNDKQKANVKVTLKRDILFDLKSRLPKIK